jgi:hypothetical protein
MHLCMRGLMACWFFGLVRTVLYALMAIRLRRTGTGVWGTRLSPNTLCLEDTYMTTIHWTNDFKAACAQADLDHKLILLDFFSPT